MMSCSPCISVNTAGRGMLGLRQCLLQENHKIEGLCTRTAVLLLVEGVASNTGNSFAASKGSRAHTQQEQKMEKPNGREDPEFSNGRGWDLVCARVLMIVIII
jgi:hypothetical protein